MLPIIADHLPEIRDLCAKSGARRLDLFGSVARGDFEANQSDFDFLVQFQDLGWQGSFKRYMTLKLGLEDLLGASVDLVEIDAITNPHFLKSANENRQLLYAS